MSSGRDVWMESWTQEEKKQYSPILEIKKAYKDVLLKKIAVLDYEIKELENEQKKTI
jgi:hypothetical protein